MKDNSGEAIFVEYFSCQDILHYIRDFLPLSFRPIDLEYKPTAVKPDRLVKSIGNKAKQLKFNQSRFQRLLTTHINALAAGGRPTRSLENLLRSHCEKVKSEISTIPNSPDKARNALLALIKLEAFSDSDQVYDAMVLLSDEVSPQLVAKVVRDWKEEATSHKERHRNSVFDEGEIFWVSLDFREDIDGVSRYRFREHFGIGEFEPAFAEVELMLASALLEGSTGPHAALMPFWGDQRLTSVAYDLWLTSRSRNLPNRVRDFVNVALRRIAGWQFPGGWWTDFVQTEPPVKDPKTGLPKSRYLPSTYTTALCSLNLLKLCVSEPMKQQGILGAKWLLEQQNPDGSWSLERRSENGVVEKQDLFVTLLSLEAIARSGIENVGHSIELGIEWIMQQQGDLGMWDDEGFPFPFMTVLVLEFIKSKDSYSRKLDAYLSMSRDFLNRSVQLSLEDNPNSRRLAIITAFQAIEAFLYSVLDHLNIKIFEKSDETIGMRKALIRFQEYLQDARQIKRNEVIPYRNSLDRLAYLRDQVVHKGIDVTDPMCRPLVDDALNFAVEYSLKIFRHDPWA